MLPLPLSFERERDVPNTASVTSHMSTIKVSPVRSGFKTRVQMFHLSTATLIWVLDGVVILTLENGSRRKSDSSANTMVTLEFSRVSIPYHG